MFAQRSRYLNCLLIILFIESGSGSGFDTLHKTPGGVKRASSEHGKMLCETKAQNQSSFCFWKTHLWGEWGDYWKLQHSSSLVIKGGFKPFKNEEQK